MIHILQQQNRLGQVSGHPMGLVTLTFASGDTSGVCQLPCDKPDH